MSSNGLRLDISRLVATVGREQELGRLSSSLADVVGGGSFGVVGAVHITCADEAQHRVIEKVQELLVERHVTPMASGEHTAFRLINLGGHHEPGALAIAENHWAGAGAASEGPKLMVVRVDAHVGVDVDPAGHPVYGRFLRFDQPSVACGALAAVLRGVALRGSEGFVDAEVRARRLVDAFPEPTRLAAAAICRAEISAADCLAEIGALHPDTPTVWLVVATVTLNHPDRHASMLTGVHVVDVDGEPSGTSLGLDVERYTIDHDDHGLRVTV